jgi:hypothetical protein
MSILRELKQELSLMASLSDMPNIPWNEMSLCSRHVLLVNQELFATEKLKNSI